MKKGGKEEGEKEGREVERRIMQFEVKDGEIFHLSEVLKEQSNLAKQ